jgi:mannose-1-phosphate guanylyltransferase
MTLMKSQGRRWAIVLAGGEGERLRPFVEWWLGYHRPKQFCTFVGAKSLLRQTVDRAVRLVQPDQILTVIGPGHRKYLQERSHADLPGRIIEQPRDLDTGPAVFLSLAQIMARDPNATVLIFPTDHFVQPQGRFLTYADFATRVCELYPDRLVLLGAFADSPETEFGWIENGPYLSLNGSLRSLARPVARFREKPDLTEARDQLDAGSLWSTMVVAAQASTLWSIGRQLLKGVSEQLESYLQVHRAVVAGRAPREHEDLAIAHIYDSLSASDFSRDLLQYAATDSLVLPMQGLYWSDWGRPDRIVQSLAQVGVRPHFPMTYPGTDAGASRAAHRVA